MADIFLLKFRDCDFTATNLGTIDCYYDTRRWRRQHQMLGNLTGLSDAKSAGKRMKNLGACLLLDGDLPPRLGLAMLVSKGRSTQRIFGAQYLSQCDKQWNANENGDYDNQHVFYVRVKSSGHKNRIYKLRRPAEKIV